MTSNSDKVDDTTEAKAAEADEAKTAEEAKVDNNDFTVVEEEGQEKFKCNNCDLKLDKVISIKRHITSKHVVKTPGRKRKSMESAKVETNTKEAKIDDDLSDSLMEGLGTEYTSTQADIDNMDKLLDEYESKLENDSKDETVIELETHIETKEEDAASKLEEIEKKYNDERNKNAVLHGTINLLNDTKDKLKEQIDRQARVLKKQSEELEKVKAIKGGTEAALSQIQLYLSQIQLYLSPIQLYLSYKRLYLF